MSATQLQPTEIAAMLADLVDMLLPGDELFPKASAVGLQGLVAARVRAARGEAGLDALLQALADCGARPDRLDGEVVARLEREHEELFALVRTAAYLGYYESPAVHAAIRALGHPYHAALLPEGYDVPPFDPAIDTPRHGRGFYRKTDEVTPVDLSGLDFLDADPGRG